jgi:hypothetical protein
MLRLDLFSEAGFVASPIGLAFLLVWDGVAARKALLLHQDRKEGLAGCTKKEGPMRRRSSCATSSECLCSTKTVLVQNTYALSTLRESNNFLFQKKTETMKEGF